MDNFSSPGMNGSAQVNVPGIIAFQTVFMLIVTIPVTIVNIAIIIALAVENSISRPIRIVLINTPIACVIVAIGLFVNQVTSLYNSTYAIESDIGIDPTVIEGVCRFVFFCWGMGGAGRLAFMALYAITVMLIVLLKANNLKSVLMFIVVGSVWLLVFLFIVWFLVPLAFTSIFDSVSCVPLPSSGSGVEFTIVYCVIFGLLCFTITIVIPFITLYYIKKHTLKDQSNNIASALAKFAFFLLVGNVFNILSEILPTILAATIAGSLTDTSGISMAVLSIIAVSLIPSPIFIIAYFKNIQKRLFQQCTKQKKKNVSSKNSSNFTEKSIASAV